jgi:lipopolysaccharide transport system permease protein
MNSNVFTAVLLAFHLARAEISSRYARSSLGSFWVTVQQALYVGFAGVVFHQVFDMTLASYLPYFAISLLFWNFLSSAVLDSMEALPANAPMIKDRGFAPDIFLFAAFLRNILVSAHALPVPVGLFIVFGGVSPGGFILALPGFVSFFAATAGISYVLGIFAARYRDFKRLVESILQIAFLVTPIIWKPSFVAGQAAVVYGNPLAHLLDAWRQPLLEGTLPVDSLAISWAIALFSLLAAALVRRTTARIVIWI